LRGLRRRYRRPRRCLLQLPLRHEEGGQACWEGELAWEAERAPKEGQAREGYPGYRPQCQAEIHLQARALLGWFQVLQVSPGELLEPLESLDPLELLEPLEPLELLELLDLPDLLEPLELLEGIRHLARSLVPAPLVAAQRVAVPSEAAQ
jgi:hypothetical protein